jgi:hypothetical protein
LTASPDTNDPSSDRAGEPAVVEPAAATLPKFQKELSAGTVSLVLLALLGRAQEPLYGYQIAKRLKGSSLDGLPLKQGTPRPFWAGSRWTPGNRRGHARAISSTQYWRDTLASDANTYLDELRAELADFGSDENLYRWWQMPLLVIGGVLLILVTLNLIRLAGRVHGFCAKAMLVRAGRSAA